MGDYTFYLTVIEEAPERFRVGVEAQTPLPAIREALRRSLNLRYSPILPAFLSPEKPAVPPPSIPRTIAFFFAPKPYQALGLVRTGLSETERQAVFFSQGLASILMLDCEVERARSLKPELGCLELEHWTMADGILERPRIVFDQTPSSTSKNAPLDLLATGYPELDVYVEQISASISTLWHFYGAHFPEECHTLRRVHEIAKRLIGQRGTLAKGKQTITSLKQQNAITSALVELSAALSYAVTQGASRAACGRALG